VYGNDAPGSGHLISAEVTERPEAIAPSPDGCDGAPVQTRPGRAGP
jgi:hypothetical protein